MVYSSRLSFERSQLSMEYVDGSVLGGLAYQGIIVGGMCFAIQTTLLQNTPLLEYLSSALTPLFGISAAAIFREDPLSFYCSFRWF